MSETACTRTRSRTLAPVVAPHPSPWKTEDDVEKPPASFGVSDWRRTSTGVQGARSGTIWTLSKGCGSRSPCPPMEPRASLSCALACLSLDLSLRYGVLYGVLYEIEGELVLLYFCIDTPVTQHNLNELTMYSTFCIVDAADSYLYSTLHGSGGLFNSTHSYAGSRLSSSNGPRFCHGRDSRGSRVGLPDLVLLKLLQYFTSK